MQSEQFDELSRGLGKGISRRQALRYLIGLALGGVAAHFGFPESSVVAQDEILCVPVNAFGTCEPGTTIQTRTGYIPQKNGCGPLNRPRIRANVPQRFRNVSFVSACDTHDLCYQICGTTQEQCDDRLEDDLYNLCDQAYPGFLQAPLKDQCKSQADVYVAAVILGGASSWLEGQQSGCECCSTCPACSACEECQVINSVATCVPIDCGDPCLECQDGACVPIASCCGGTSCAGTCCNNRCIDTTSDASNCGGCGIACTDGQVCKNGSCVTTDACNGCPAGTTCTGIAECFGDEFVCCPNECIGSGGVCYVNTGSLCANMFTCPSG